MYHKAMILILLTMLLIHSMHAAAHGQAGEESSISGDPETPHRHFRVPNPATLSPVAAEDIYQAMLGEMLSGYRLSGLVEATGCAHWQRHNHAPYRPATHRRCFVNNYADAVAGAHGRYENAGLLLVGSALAKDRFTVTREVGIQAVPHFLIEKMPNGFSHVGGDWRYAMVMPDGSLFGETGGDNSRRVACCIDCHPAAGIQGSDHIFPAPDAFGATGVAISP